MKNILVRRPKSTDVQALHQFFFLVIQDTFAKEGLTELVEDQHTEWAMKKHYLAMDLASQGQQRFFLVAVEPKTGEIIGTIEYGEANALIQQTIQEDLTNCPEIGTVYVHPSYQQRGIGTVLFRHMLTTLETQQIPSFCLDSGYRQAQIVWQKKLGKPDVCLEHYWEPNTHHMIWKRSIPF
ncbi:GNAT family N-acetyltransferase [Lysinibacillus macroides]|uniref:GNAT family acetyltransferase n=1 Tax=Lysinibacillus macroides TaxID=33935 RepID=A0A0M9DHY6_9BACI|nr:GNAT family N-acetyltransferase [Lysinibacillus macroides]KOY80973.1 GNAT family acetyltransferase [Lysinibacillus macroides]QPR68885.1 GNAT family N-acetyltransferase [Lysinibacillus macroides]